jgi:hypothetical protein
MLGFDHRFDPSRVALEKPSTEAAESMKRGRPIEIIK